MSSNLSRDDVTEEDNLLVEAVSLLVRRQRETESWVAEQVCQAEARSVASEQRYAALETRLAGIEDQLARLVRGVGPSRGDGEGDLDARLARLREQVQGLKTAADRPPAAASDANHVGAGAGPVAPPLGEVNHVTQAPVAVDPASSRTAPAPSSGTRLSGAAAGPAPELRSAATAAPVEEGAASLPGSLTSPTLAPSAEANHVIPPVAPPSNDAVGPATLGLGAQTVAAGAPREVTSVPAPAGTSRGVAAGGQFSGFLELLGDTPQNRFGLILIGVGLIAVVYAVLSQLHLG